MQDEVLDETEPVVLFGLEIQDNSLVLMFDLNFEKTKWNKTNRYRKQTKIC